MRWMPVIVFAISVGFGGVSWGADDPSITGDTRKGIQSAMTSHIQGNLFDGKYVVYDAVDGHLKKLKFDKVHEGIVKKGGFYVSCADFVDDQGKQYDLDLLVVEERGSFRVLETVVHSIDGKKRKYHLED
jgi:hypothetical protein